MARLFVATSICFFVVWFTGKNDLLSAFIPYSNILSDNYLFSGIMLIGYIAATSNKNEAI